jgi:drug/metabolite transporter (DMT)-like permease
MPTVYRTDHSAMKRAPETDATDSAKLMVVLLAFAWGFSWIATAEALREVSPWSLRFAASTIGVSTLAAAALVTGHDLRLPPGERLHVAIAGFFNVAVFNIMSAFAQLAGATSRVVIIAYSMPIWAVALSRILLGERLNAIRMVAIALCAAGLTILVWPQFAAGPSLSVLFSLASALSWAFATVYLKWVKAQVAPLANATWQLLFGGAFIGIGMLAFDHYPRIWPLHGASLLALLYLGVIGVGLAHFLWWSIVGRLPTATAAIGALLVPVVGVIASTVILGERPTWADIIGFALIFAAAACVLLQPNVRHDEMPE